MAFLAAGEGRRLFGFTTPSELPNKFAMCVRQPVGVCAFVTPWNFPDGDPGVEGHGGPHCRQLGRHQAGHRHARLRRGPRASPRGGRAPAGRLERRHGLGRRRSAIRSSRIPMSRSCPSPARPKSGRRISVACAPTFKRLHLEMGGKNAILVMEDADIDLAVDGACGARSERPANAARRPRASSSTASVYAEFLEKLVARRRRAAGRQRTRARRRDGSLRLAAPARDGRPLRRDRERTRAPSSSAAARRSRRARSRRAGSSSRRCSRTRRRPCASRGRKSSARSRRSFRSSRSTRGSASPTPCRTGSPARSTRRT